MPEFRVTHFEKGEDTLRLKCEYRETIAQCPRCYELSTEVHESKEREVRDLSMSGKRVILHIEGRRFHCEKCGRPFTERQMSIEHRRRQTRRYEQYVYEQCLESSRKGVAKREKLSETTVKEIFIKWAKQSTRHSMEGHVQTLGIDELSLVKRRKQYVLVLSDLDRHWIIAILPDRKKRTLIRWLKALSHDQRRAIQVVSTDMWEPYRQAIHEVLPWVQHVADRFHVMKQLNERLSQARRAIQKRADEATRKALKGSRWILVRARDDLNAKEEAKLQAVLAASPELRTMYLLKEEFRLICDKARDRQQAARFLLAWIYKVRATGNTRLLKFVATLRNWWDEFLNYFIDRVTQGFVEGINNAVRFVIRRAFGFRNFDNFRLHILAQYGGG